VMPPSELPNCGVVELALDERGVGELRGWDVYGTCPTGP
jgi:hypothetical protein